VSDQQRDTFDAGNKLRTGREVSMGMGIRCEAFSILMIHIVMMHLSAFNAPHDYKDTNTLVVGGFHSTN